MKLRRTAASILMCGTVAAAGISFASTAAAHAAPQPQARAKPAVSYLFSVTAETGTLRPVKGKAGTYVLTLRGASPAVTWFTDRPVRDSGLVPTAEFVKKWDRYGFRADPPNVALTARVADGVTDTVVATMTDPRLSRGALTARLRVLSIDEARALKGHLAGHGKRHDGDVPARLATVALFIDNVNADSCTIRSMMTC